METGEKPPDTEGAPAGDEESSEDEFGLRDVAGTGVVGARLVVMITAMPSFEVSDDDSDDDEDISLRDTNTRLLEGRDVGDQDTREVSDSQDTLGHDTAADTQARRSVKEGPTVLRRGRGGAGARGKRGKKS